MPAKVTKIKAKRVSAPVKPKEKTVKKKTVTKKSEAKTTTSAQKSRKKPLVVVSGEVCFWVNNGSSLSSLKDLHDALSVMSNEQYLHHTGMGRNDFASWVKDVLGDDKCAAALLKAKNMQAAMKAVEKHLKTYSI